MKPITVSLLFSVLIFSFFLLLPQKNALAQMPSAVPAYAGAVDSNTDTGISEHQNNGDGHAAEHDDSHGAKAPGWLVIPFAALLIMIATGPLFYERFWHHYYPHVSCVLAVLVVSYYIFILHNSHGPVHAVAEYVQFIALIGSLYIASGGILIKVDKKGRPMANVIILLIGAVLSNFIGTTGASMLLIRPFIRLNEGQEKKAYLVVFFIFIVSNIGGSLTPIGDPPLFLGFLKGVPFEWSLIHNFLPWCFGIGLLTAIFYFLDTKIKKQEEDFIREYEESHSFSGKISLEGSKNFIWLALVIGAVFIDPNVFDWVPGIEYHGQKFSFIRELIMGGIALASFKLADEKAHKGNEFNFEPIREVAFVFIGIFGTMMPALEIVADFAKSPTGAAMINPNSLYWGTGMLSGFLDNAPTYLNFLTAALAAGGSDISLPADVARFAEGGGFSGSVLQLKAISVSAVFFGALTYIGNGPNFMVKSIAEQRGVEMPSFFGYILRYSLIYLFPVLILTWLVFFYLA